MNHFQRATIKDVSMLRLIANQSEAHWGYSEEFMNVFDQEFNIVNQFVTENPVYVLWNEKKPTAFWGMKQENNEWELEYFYVAESEIGNSFGKLMWNHLISYCKEQKITFFHFVTSPQAVGFYHKMGAIQDQMTKSSIDGRWIPHFIYLVK